MTSPVLPGAEAWSHDGTLDTGGVADVGDPGRRVATLGEQSHRRIDELLLAFLALLGVLARRLTLRCVVMCGHGLSSAAP